MLSPRATDADPLVRYRKRWLQVAAASAEPPPGYAALCSAAERNLGLRAKDSRQIEVDLNRSSVAVLPVPEAGKEAHRAALRRLLRAWCVLRPEVGYSQAMNFVASAMLCVVEHDENAAFRLFAALLGRLPPDFYAEQPPLRGFTVEVDALLHLLERRLPSLGLTADALERVGEAMPLVLAKWFLNLWVDVLPLPCLLGAWDLMLGGGALEAAEAARSGGVALEAAAADTNVRVALGAAAGGRAAASTALGSGGAADGSAAYLALLRAAEAPTATDASLLLRAAAAVDLPADELAAARALAREELCASDGDGAAAAAAGAAAEGGAAEHLSLSELEQLRATLADRDSAASAASPRGRSSSGGGGGGGVTFGALSRASAT